MHSKSARIGSKLVFMLVIPLLLRAHHTNRNHVQFAAQQDRYNMHPIQQAQPTATMTASVPQNVGGFWPPHRHAPTSSQLAGMHASACTQMAPVNALSAGLGTSPPIGLDVQIGTHMRGWCASTNHLHPLATDVSVTGNAAQLNLWMSTAATATVQRDYQYGM